MNECLMTPQHGILHQILGVRQWYVNESLNKAYIKNSYNHNLKSNTVKEVGMLNKKYY